jgi:hypothetical protein
VVSKGTDANLLGLCENRYSESANRPHLERSEAVPLTLELPVPLEEELRHEAEKEGVSAAEHAALLLSILTTLLREEDTTLFQDAVKTFLSKHSLDATLVASVFAALVQQAHDLGEPPDVKAVSDAASERVSKNLRAWRNLQVHEPIDLSLDEMNLSSPPLGKPLQRAGRVNRRQTAMGKYAHVVGTSEDFAREKQKEIAHEDRPRT